MRPVSREAAEAREREIARPRTRAPAHRHEDTPANPRPDLERRITVDARSRPDMNRVFDPVTVIHGGEAVLVHGGHERARRRGEPEGANGFPYRAIANGRELTWCRVAGSPGEGSNKGKPLV